VKSIICGVILAALVSPAFANEYWVEYNYTTHQCSIVEKKSQEKDTGTPQAVPNSPPNVTASGTPNNGTTPTILPASSAPANTTVVTAAGGSSDAAPTTSAAAPGSPPTTLGSPTATNPDDNKNDPTAALAAAWERKKTAAEAAGTADVQTAIIGTAMHSRTEAESEMQVIRKCGIAN